MPSVLGRPTSLAALGAGLALALFSAPASATPEAPVCEVHSIPVSISPGAPVAHQVTGELCGIGNPTNRTLQLLVHGILTTRQFWDFEYRPNKYSYARDAWEAGYFTFTVDRIGSGESSRPPSTAVGIDSSVYALHQVVQKLRAGTVGGVLGSVQYKRIVELTWAYSGAVGITHAAQYPTDLDSLVLLGFLHDLTPQVIELLNTKLYPASADSRFAGQTFPDGGYLTLLPGERHNVLFSPGEADPNVVAYDEAHPGTVTLGELNDVPRIFGTESLGVKVPTLIIVGDTDRVFCNNQVDCTKKKAIKDFEEPFFGPEACLTVKMVQNIGHGTTMSYKSPKVYRKILEWVDDYAGTNALAAPTSSCACQ